MKKLHKLTTEEIKDLVSFTTTEGGPTLYYAEVDAIGPDYMVYKGTTLRTIGVPGLRSIKKGKEDYEMYKILSATTNAAEFIRTEAQEVIKDSYEGTLELHLQRVEEKTGVLIECTQDTLRKLSSAASNTDSMCTEMKLTTDHVKESLKRIDVDGLRDKVNSLTTSFIPLKDTLNSLITELRTLFK